MKEGSPTQQQLHHLGVAFFGCQVKRREASLVTFVQQTGVCHGLQQAVTCIDAAVPREARDEGVQLHLCARKSAHSLST